MNTLLNKIHSLFTRGRISSVNDAGGLQKVQVSGLHGELKDGVERLQEYGFTSCPKNDSEALMVSLSGNRDHSLIIKIDDSNYRLKGLSQGEVAIYTDEGDKIHLKRGNKIEVVTKEFSINSEKFKMQGQSAELIEELIKLVDELTKVETPTAMGPQMFLPAHAGVFADIKSKLESIKV